MNSALVKMDYRFGMVAFVDGKWIALSKAEELDVLVLLAKEK